MTPVGQKPWVCNRLTSMIRTRRSLPAFAAALLLVLVAHPSPITFVAGLPLVITGEALRIWAAGHLHKNRELAVGGPYARLRHPLYVGTFLIVMGFCLISGFREASVAGPPLLAFFFGYYIPYKESREGRRLERRHGDLYAVYRAEVPAPVPRWSRWRIPADCRVPQQWDWSRVRENDEMRTALAMACTVALFGVLALVG